MKNNIKKDKIAIIGLGYVGLPLAVEFAKYYKVVGYDIDKKLMNQKLYLHIEHPSCFMNMLIKLRLKALKL